MHFYWKKWFCFGKNVFWFRKSCRRFWRAKNIAKKKRYCSLLQQVCSPRRASIPRLSLMNRVQPSSTPLLEISNSKLSYNISNGLQAANGHMNVKCEKTVPQKSCLIDVSFLFCLIRGENTVWPLKRPVYRAPICTR